MTKIFSVKPLSLAVHSALALPSEDSRRVSKSIEATDFISPSTEGVDIRKVRVGSKGVVAAWSSWSQC